MLCIDVQLSPVYAILSSESSKTSGLPAVRLVLAFTVTTAKSTVVSTTSASVTLCAPSGSGSVSKNAPYPAAVDTSYTSGSAPSMSTLNVLSRLVRFPYSMILVPIAPHHTTPHHSTHIPKDKKSSALTRKRDRHERRTRPVRRRVCPLRSRSVVYRQRQVPKRRRDAAAGEIEVLRVSIIDDNRDLGIGGGHGLLLSQGTPPPLYRGAVLRAVVEFSL